MEEEIPGGEECLSPFSGTPCETMRISLFLTKYYDTGSMFASSLTFAIGKRSRKELMGNSGAFCGELISKKRITP